MFSQLEKAWLVRSRIAILVALLVVVGALAARKYYGGPAPTWAAEPVEAVTMKPGDPPKTDTEWKTCLTPEQYRVLREKGTERAFTGRYYNFHGTGTYTCAGCGAPLFNSDEKFDSGTGWPSFWKPAAGAKVREESDRAHGMDRTEVLCDRCGGHLGHVFEDGPAPTGMRYCINSASLNFKTRGGDMDEATTGKTETVTFGAGCFWCTEAVYRALDGVKTIKVGYMGGAVTNPTYEQVCEGGSGHAEVAQIEYDPSKVSLDKLLEIFWKMHDPTSLDRQGNDHGPQYRSVIFVRSDEQRRVAEASRAERQKAYDDPIVTAIVPAETFYEAENYHQDYYRNNSSEAYCRLVIAPKLKKLAPLLNQRPSSGLTGEHQ